MLASGLQNKMYTTDVPLTPGKTYKFRVEARNSVGYSLASVPFAIIASQVPDKPDAPTTTRVESTIVVTWSAPQFNGGATITSYIINF